MQWAVRNARRSERGQITKAVSGTGKIDPLVALANAAMVMQECPPVFSADAVIGTLAAAIVGAALFASIYLPGAVLCATECLL